MLISIYGLNWVFAIIVAPLVASLFVQTGADWSVSESPHPRGIDTINISDC